MLVEIRCHNCGQVKPQRQTTFKAGNPWCIACVKIVNEEKELELYGVKIKEVTWLKPDEVLLVSNSKEEVEVDNELEALKSLPEGRL